ncbi:hypothetical protein AVS17_004929 [Escherichia coli]|nr:hypothetical protein [Escherichia coli]EES3123803.1 hypothetical protein [Escherichia coli]EET3340907.1 hypothetical protein [Escherichia coli]EEX9896188.1 hypothetical protein [Escherichia coli]EEY1937325.1 hypothetical protein [Escherichia coli]
MNRNIAVGPGNENSVIRALSMLSFRRMNGNLRPNGQTADFMTNGGQVNYIYPSIYNKSYDLLIHSMKKIEFNDVVVKPDFYRDRKTELYLVA